MDAKQKEELKLALNDLDNLLKDTNLDNVTADSAGYEQLPDGYYLSEVIKAELTVSKSSKQPMVAFQFKTTDDGLMSSISASGEVFVEPIEKTKNRTIFMYYVLKDETSVRRFVTDMLKFEGDVAGEPLLPKEAFTTSETIEDALDILTGYRLYIQVSTTVKEDDNSKSVWYNFITWKRAAMLELPI